MSEKREYDQRYSAKWKSIVNFMKNNTGITISGIARAGSRRKGNYRAKSDLDIIFAVKNDPPKKQIYPILKAKLQQGFPAANVEIGTSYNVINMSLDSLKFDIVLRTLDDFKSQVQQYKLEEL